MEMKKKKMTNKVQHVVLAVIIMALMNSGSVVICVKDGSMVNVLKSLPLRLSTSSNTSALAAVTKGLEFESSNLWTHQQLNRQDLECLITFLQVKIASCSSQWCTLMTMQMEFQVLLLCSFLLSNLLGNCVK